MKKLTTFFALIISAVVSAQPGSSRQIGTAGNLAGTVSAVEANGRIYTVDKTGALLVTETVSGTSTQLGNERFVNSRFLFAGGVALYSIKQDGSLYVINTADGSSRPAGVKGAWKSTLAGTTLNGKLYTVETSGELYETDLATGIRKEIGKPEFAATATSGMWSANGKLYTCEANGALFEVNQETGVWKRIGATEEWKGTITGVVINNLLYTIETDGFLYETDLTTGKWSQIGKAEYANTAFMTGSSTGKLHTIDRSGNLFEIGIK